MEDLLNKLFDKLEEIKEYSPVYCYPVKETNQTIRSFFEEELSEVLPKSETNEITLLGQRKVMFKFDEDEPMHFNSITEGGQFTIQLKEGSIKFEKDGKSFSIYIE